MSDPRLIKIMKKLHDRTLKGELGWEEIGGRSDSYQISFPDYSLIIQREETAVGPDVYTLILLNDEGRIVASIDSREDPEVIQRELKEIFENVRKKSLKVDQVLDKVLKDLST
ncbi:MAG: hypothetical protein HYY96_16610 [Candidatus Tectomicrobia bacterium]|nr:hypothetical protein [Candidatus Tectomicrobia bacterium]